MSGSVEASYRSIGPEVLATVAGKTLARWLYREYLVMANKTKKVPNPSNTFNVPK
jgi:hypothetical protein